MSLSTNQKERLKLVVSASLDRAEAIWEEVGPKLQPRLANAMALMEKSGIPSQIPGHPVVREDNPQVGDFIAFVADMRDSTKHLLQAISEKTAKVSQLQRVFYETSALLPCLSKVVSYHEGSTTEYLGDGILALFGASGLDKGKSIYAAHRAARDCFVALHSVVNPELHRRYRLPALQMGIGMGLSRAVVTLVGLPEFQQPKVFGECVYRATKLSGVADSILICETLQFSWPTSKTGTLRFIPRKVKDVDGYIVREK